MNGTIDDQCWRDALIYRSSEIVERLFSFASLSVYVEAFRGYHPNEVCSFEKDQFQISIYSASSMIPSNSSIDLWKIISIMNQLMFN